MDHVLILGAGSGIGAAVARRIAAPGLGLILHTGRNGAGLAAVAADCRAAGAEAETFLGDLGAEATLAEAEARLAALPPGGLTGLVFAAGHARRGTVADTPAEAVAAALAAMPLAFHRVVAAATPVLAHGRGRVVCVGAFGAHLALTHSFAATAPAKAALEAQVRVFAANLAPLGITVNAVVPGYVEKEPGTRSALTPEQWAGVIARIPMGRIARREEVAAVIAFLLGPEAGYVTGQAIGVNGGLGL